MGIQAMKWTMILNSVATIGVWELLRAAEKRWGKAPVSIACGAFCAGCIAWWATTL